jgi:hypothetical protein
MALSGHFSLAPSIVGYLFGAQQWHTLQIPPANSRGEFVSRSHGPSAPGAPVGDVISGRTA